MEDKISTVRMSYQGRGSNCGRIFGIGRGNSYGRGQGRVFNSTKQKVQGKCEALGSDLYSIEDA